MNPAYATNETESFAGWLLMVDAACLKQAGVSRDDLPDCGYADWYEEGVPAGLAARKAIRMATCSYDDGADE